MSDGESVVDRIESLLYVERDGKFGGYRVDLLKEELPSYMKRLVTCSRCEGVMRDATGVGSPQLFMCAVCVVGSTHSALGPNREAVGNLVILCPLKSRGCEWEGHISSSETHLDTCAYMWIECHVSCGCVVRRMGMEIHLSVECPLREIRCEHCEQSHKETDTSLHMGECAMLPVTCVSGCGDTLRRGDMLPHREVCSFSLLPCDYREYGCDMEIKRKDRDTHATEYRLQHMEMLMVSGMQKIREELDRVKEDNISLRKELDATKQELSAFQVAMDSVVGETRGLKRGLKEATFLSACLKQELQTKCDDRIPAVPVETHFPAYSPGQLAFSVDRVSQLTNEKRPVFVYADKVDKDTSPRVTKLTVICKIVGLISKLQLSCLLSISSPHTCQLDTTTTVLNRTLQTPCLVYRNTFDISPATENRLIGHFNAPGEEDMHSIVLGEVPVYMLMAPGICLEDSISVQLCYELKSGYSKPSV